MFKRILRLTKINYKKIKAFLARKDILIFLFFLLLSFCFWYLQSLRNIYEITLPVQIEFVNIPIDRVNEDKLLPKVEVTIRDAGSLLLSYRFNRIEPITLNLQQIATSDGNNLFISSDVLQSRIRANLSHTANIVRTNPTQIIIPLVDKSHKRLRVKHAGNITFAQQNALSDSIRIEPQYVIAFGDINILDTMTYAFTEIINFNNLSYSVNQTINLQRVPSIQFNEKQVNINIPVENFTEKVVNVPIVGKNIPENFRLRTFPSTVQVTFFVPFSRFSTASAEDFTVYIDFENVEHSETRRQKPTVISTNPFVFNIRINPQEVGYLIEEYLLTTIEYD